MKAATKKPKAVIARLTRTSSKNDSQKALSTNCRKENGNKASGRGTTLQC